jgi:hypothetical protein
MLMLITLRNGLIQWTCSCHPSSSSSSLVAVWLHPPSISVRHYFPFENDIARTVCRRTERNLVGLYKLDEIEPSAYKYVNRLSDYLFTCARLCALVEGKEETIYKKAKIAKKDE